VIAALADELADFRTTKGSVAFEPGSPLPDGVVDRLVLARRDEIDAMRARKR
jgi:uncharacterized protein YdhG (YjbR/CyaY superfamily)